ncbi:uncharacterized protein NPIL_466981 [Nephila pilipes]|uniref:Uncharacterized protein n=1 Tax=Nephila pilipes TaxID=299642 RepID=A0A8X6QTT9_NEPPI|nr:uncharacterized protein NPIL_466981 [Nephila pilipes]
MDLSYLSESENHGDCNLLNHNNIYSMMKEELREDFSAFKPLTNIWWLAHLTCNVHSMQREQCFDDPRLTEMSRTALYALERLKDNILRYSSTMQFLHDEVFNINQSDIIHGRWSNSIPASSLLNNISK